MGAVDTTYTFTATDTITSAKMNNIIDQTTMTSDAVDGTTLEVVSGKLKVKTITSSQIGSSSVIQSALAPNVAGNGPLIYATTTVATTVPTGLPATKITLNTVSPDTNNNFANSRFTPTVAGHYQINGAVFVTGSGVNSLAAYIHRNGSPTIGGSSVNALTYNSVTSIILYLNGAGDYVELFASHSNGSNASVSGAMNACLIRSA